jgi:glycosyltransferase involved in cell wall biosynthesis
MARDVRFLAPSKQRREVSAMKVLMFGWEYPPHITGGLGTACHGLSSSLSRLVERLTFVMPHLAGCAEEGPVNLVSASHVELTAAEAQSAEADAAHILEYVAIDSPLRPYVSPDAYLKTIVRDFPMARQSSKAESQTFRVELTGSYGPTLFDEIARYAIVAAQLARRQEYDVIHAHDWMTFPAGMAAKRVSGAPLIVHVHALEFDRCGESIHQGVYDIEREGMEAADLIIAVSRRTKQMIHERYGIAEEKVRVVHNGIAARRDELDQPRKAEEAPVRQRRLPGRLVVFLGRVTMQKGPEYFLEAAYLVKKRLDDVRFVMAGTGDMWTRMVARMSELDLLDCFHFTGFVDEKRRNQLLSMADLFVMSSVSEPFGLTPVEALQHGVPVIVSRQAGVSEVLTGAVKVDFWDVRRIADAIINVLGNESLARQLREDGGRDLQHLDWDSAARRVVDVYEEVMR